MASDARGQRTEAPGGEGRVERNDRAASLENGEKADRRRDFSPCAQSDERAGRDPLGSQPSRPASHQEAERPVSQVGRITAPTAVLHYRGAIRAGNRGEGADLGERPVPDASRQAGPFFPGGRRKAGARRRTPREMVDIHEN